MKIEEFVSRYEAMTTTGGEHFWIEDYGGRHFVINNTFKEVVVEKGGELPKLNMEYLFKLSRGRHKETFRGTVLDVSGNIFRIRVDRFEDEKAS